MMIRNYGFQETDALVHRKMWGEKSHGKYLKRQFRMKRNIYSDQNDEGSHIPPGCQVSSENLTTSLRHVVFIIDGGI